MGLTGARALVATWMRKLPRTAGGYAEHVSSPWVEAASLGALPERSALAQLRLAYTFLHAGKLGLEGAAAAGISALAGANRVFWREELRGWTRRADLEGACLDATVDSYDQAFGLLALAWDGSGPSRSQAYAALAGLDEECRGPGGGYREFRNGFAAPGSLPVAGLRRQNPHMHLLEAFLAWWKVDPEGPWRERAAAMVALLRNRFLESGEGFLREYFDENWLPLGGESGSSLESGHHFEWVWLLSEYRKLSGDDSVALLARKLYDFALKRGVDTDALAFERISPRGEVVAGTKLLWPQTEQLKAHLAVYEWSGDAAARAAAQRVLRLIGSLYLGDGFFVNALDRDRHPIHEPTRSRLLYHIFLALAEAERVLEPKSEDLR